MMFLRIKHWETFQHYKDRNPTWIKLHKSLLDNFEYQSLPLASRALAPMLWLLASEYPDISKGLIEYNFKKIAFRLHTTEREVEDAVGPLIANGFLEVCKDASGTLAEPEQVDSPETYREEREEDIEKKGREDTHFAREAFREIYDAGSEAFPALATRNSTVIGQWIEAGATPEDALPEIARAKAGGVDVKAWKYFSGGVMDALKTRTTPLPEGQHRGQAPPKKSHMHGIMEAAAKGVQNAERGRE